MTSKVFAPGSRHAQVFTNHKLTRRRHVLSLQNRHARFENQHFLRQHLSQAADSTDGPDAPAAASVHASEPYTDNSNLSGEDLTIDSNGIDVSQAHDNPSNGSASSSLNFKQQTTPSLRLGDQTATTPPQQLANQQQQQQPQQTQPGHVPLVPWGLPTTITVLFVWLLSFWAAAYLAVPTILDFFDIDPMSPLARVQAFRHLLLDILQLGITITVLRRALSEYNPRKLGLFNISFQPWKKWATAVAAGGVLFPLVDWVHKSIVTILSRGLFTAAGGGAAGGGAAGGGMDNLVSGSDWVARALWAFVLAVCAPIWEEAMFRGFLLPSLAKYMPVWAAVAGSSVVFASVHFTREGFVPLLMLGVIFGSSYVKSLNLVAPILLHSLWNVCLLAQILFLG